MSESPASSITKTKCLLPYLETSQVHLNKNLNQEKIASQLKSCTSDIHIIMSHDTIMITSRQCHAFTNDDKIITSQNRPTMTNH